MIDEDDKFKIKDNFVYVKFLIIKENLFDFQKSVVKITKPLDYQDAIKILHEELHSNTGF